MKHKTSLLLFATIIFLIATHKSNAQFNINTNPYWPGSIHLNDGTIITGFIMVPNSTRENNIAFRPTEKGKEETIKRKVIKSINVTSPNGKEYTYDHISTVLDFKGRANYARNRLLLVQKQNNFVKFYVESGVYKVDSKTNDIYTYYRYRQGHDVPTTQFYMHKRDEEHAYILCIIGIVGGNSKLQNSSKRLLTEDPELLNKIMNKELGNKDIYSIIDTYLATTEGL